MNHNNICTLIFGAKYPIDNIFGPSGVPTLPRSFAIMKVMLTMSEFLYKLPLLDLNNLAAVCREFNTIIDIWAYIDKIKASARKLKGRKMGKGVITTDLRSIVDTLNRYMPQYNNFTHFVLVDIFVKMKQAQYNAQNVYSALFGALVEASVIKTPEWPAERTPESVLIPDLDHYHEIYVKKPNIILEGIMLVALKIATGYLERAKRPFVSWLKSLRCLVNLISQ